MTTSTRVPADAPARRPRSLDLRTALLLDAVVTAGNGAAYLFAASLLDDAFGLPTDVLRPIGVFLLVFGVAVGAVATRPEISRPTAVAVVALNVIWVLGSVAAAVLGWKSPTGVGVAWILAQAALVGGFAALQITGLRRQRNPQPGP